ncbi:hypothetical protein [Terrilactibacillus laevilacticus]|uniref:Uncharacterized protein n=1 Tax=Terrilactibacillus laevilacticus TaxID=1380157 RepID=A0ABW5PPE2_9BACI|nr:hypothetical protein [Terrilactibacillus laevilacticus]
MSIRDNYNQSYQYLNQAVEIMCADGKVYQGIVHSVDHENVYIQPFNEKAQRPYENEDERFFAAPFVGALTGGLIGVSLGSILAFRPCGPYGCPYPYGGGYGYGAGYGYGYGSVPPYYGPRPGYY